MLASPKKIFLLVLINCFLINFTFGNDGDDIACIPELCTQIKVSCLLPTCAPNQILERVPNPCICCPQCVTILRKCNSLCFLLNLLYNKFIFRKR